MKILSKTATVIMLMLFCVSLCVLLYPSISQYWNSKVQSKAVSDYNNHLAIIDEQAHKRYKTAADEYNKQLSELEFPMLECKSITGYESILNIDGSGIMGYISIDKIGVELPIYHGISESVLSVAAGHIEGTSLPVGGKGTHCVLSAHRGLPNAKLFTDLDKLEEGDTFTLNLLGDTLTYQVDQIKIVSPNEVNDLQLIDGEDLCTLVTCTPYGINTHRLLVRGERIQTAQYKKLYITAEAYIIDRLIVTPIVALPILAVLILIVLLKPAKPKIPESLKLDNSEKANKVNLSNSKGG